MSRSDQDYYNDGPNTAGIWAATFRRAVRSERGQKVLTELLTALDAMPEHRLIRGDWCDTGGDVCALGALHVYRKTQQLGAPWCEAQAVSAQELQEHYVGSLNGSTWTAFDLLGIQKTIAWFVADTNDAFGKETSEERWVRVYSYLKGLLNVPNS